MNLRETEFEEKLVEVTIALKQASARVDRENQRLKEQMEELSRENKKLRDEVKFSDPGEGLLLRKKCQNLEKERKTIQNEMDRLEEEVPALKRKVKKAEAREKENALNRAELEKEAKDLKMKVGQMKMQIEEIAGAKDKMAEEVKILIKFIVGAEKSKKLANLGNLGVLEQVKQAPKESVLFSEFDAGIQVDGFFNQCEADFLESPKNGERAKEEELSTVKVKGEFKPQITARKAQNHTKTQKLLRNRGRHARIAKGIGADLGGPEQPTFGRGPSNISGQLQTNFLQSRVASEKSCGFIQIASKSCARGPKLASECSSVEGPK